MGTRHLIVIVYNGRWVVAQYGQFDGYPEGAGKRIIHYLATEGFIQKLRDGLEHVYAVSGAEHEKLVQESQAECPRLSHFPKLDENGTLLRSPYDQFTEDPVNNYSLDLLRMHPSLCVRTSTAILVLIANATAENRVPVFLEPEFANDTLFCEWSYVIDLDSDSLEIFSNSERKTPEHRFVNVGAADDPVPTFIAAVPFAEMGDYAAGRKDLLRMIGEEIKFINSQRDGNDAIYFDDEE